MDNTNYIDRVFGEENLDELKNNINQMEASLDSGNYIEFLNEYFKTAKDFLYAPKQSEIEEIEQDPEIEEIEQNPEINNIENMGSWQIIDQALNSELANDLDRTDTDYACGKILESMIEAYNKEMEIWQEFPEDRRSSFYHKIAAILKLDSGWIEQILTLPEDAIDENVKDATKVIQECTAFFCLNACFDNNKERIAQTIPTITIAIRESSNPTVQKYFQKYKEQGLYNEQMINDYIKNESLSYRNKESGLTEDLEELTNQVKYYNHNINNTFNQRKESIMENTKDFSKYDTIVVHGGLFHADDLMCVAIAKTLNPDINVVRESRPDKVAEYLKDEHCLVCDVGRGEYDHHQDDALTKEDGTKYCAAGHLYKDFGHLIPMTDKNREIFETMLDSIDRHDNYGSFDSISNMFGAFVPAYDEPDLAMDSHFNLALGLLSDMLDTLDKDFNQDFKGNSELEKRFELERQPIERDFLKIIGTNNEELYDDFVTYTTNFQNILDKKEQEAIKFTNEEYAKGDNSFVCVLSEYRPWEKALVETPAIYCVYPSMRGGFNVQCVPTHDNDGRGMRLQLPENMKDNDGFIFRHAAGFVGSFETQEQAVSFANEAVTQALENASVAKNPFKVYSDMYIGKEPADQDVILTETQSAVTAFIEDYVADKGYNVTTEELYNMLSSEIDPLLAYSMTQELATSDIIIDNGFFDEEIDEEISEEEL